ncbi:MAG: DUF3667 domain-containing protein [Saprospirales bacterium]|nr:DUF3667 domain-containing protein [Saprospirales bacterium]
MATLLNLESALFRTLPNLLIPGKLTLEFSRETEKSMNPVWLFLWVSLILVVAYLSLGWSGCN